MCELLNNIQIEENEGRQRRQYHAPFRGRRTVSDSRVLVGCSEEVAIELALEGQEGFGQAFYDREERHSHYGTKTSKGTSIFRALSAQGTFPQAL